MDAEGRGDEGVGGAEVAVFGHAAEGGGVGGGTRGSGGGGGGKRRRRGCGAEVGAAWDAAEVVVVVVVVHFGGCVVGCGGDEVTGSGMGGVGFGCLLSGLVWAGCSRRTTTILCFLVEVWTFGCCWVL